jgi:hypothetical protein
MIAMKALPLALAVALFMTVPASAQNSRAVTFSVGPQVSTLGVGVGANARLSSKIGVAAEYNLFPVSDIDRRGFGNQLLIEPALRGGLLLVTFHPMGGRFTVGGGIQTGGANADMTMALSSSSATIKIGDGTYPAEEIGTLIGTLNYGSPVQPSLLVGWTGKGFNVAIGAALATPTLEISVTGPLKNDAAFRADLQKEIDDFDDSAGRIPVYPYLRLGWQFGI